MILTKSILKDFKKERLLVNKVYSKITAIL